MECLSTYYREGFQPQFIVTMFHKINDRDEVGIMLLASMTCSINSSWHHEDPLILKH